VAEGFLFRWPLRGRGSSGGKKWARSALLIATGLEASGKEGNVSVTDSTAVAEIDRVTILSLYQSTVYNETKYRRLRLSCGNKLLTISQPPSSS